VVFLTRYNYHFIDVGDNVHDGSKYLATELRPTLCDGFKETFAMLASNEPRKVNAMVITVRKVESADENRWRELFGDYIAFYQEHVPEPVIDGTWQRIIAAEDGMTGLVATDPNGVIVGIANIVFHRSTWSETWYCYLEDLYADERARGQGVGRALIEATFALADQKGATRTYWATHQQNATARRLYDRAGVLTPFVQYRR
jgi:GNAT superfamily N-acetyltransferase